MAPKRPRVVNCMHSLREPTKVENKAEVFKRRCTICVAGKKCKTFNKAYKKPELTNINIKKTFVCEIIRYKGTTHQ